MISDPLELAVCQEHRTIWKQTSKDREGASDFLSGNWKMLVWRKEGGRVYSLLEMADSMKLLI